MTPIEGSRTRRAAWVLVLFALGALGFWLAIDYSSRVPAAVEAAATPPEESRAESHAGMNGVVDEPPAERARVESERSNIPDLSDVPPAQAASTKTPAGSGLIHGRVLETWDEPITDLSLWLVQAGVDAKARYFAPSEQPSREVKTSVRGEFEFVDVAPGAWLVGPAPARAFTSTPDDPGVAPMSILVELRAGESAREIEIRAQRGFMISGRVLQPDGTPAFSGVVSARSQHAPGLCLAPTRSDGTFTLGPLVSGQYELWADGDSEGTTSVVVLAYAGDDGAVLQLREGGSLAGRVIDARAEGGSKVAIVAMRQDVEPHEMLSTSPEADGLFRFDNVAPGSYQVLAHTEDAWFAILSGVDVAGGRATGDLVLELREGGRLRLQHTSTEKVRVEIRQDDVRVSSSQIDERDTSIAAPAGRIAVRLTVGPRPTREQHIEIVPGEEEQIVLPH